MKGNVLLAFPPIGIDMGGGFRFDRPAVPPLGPLYLATPLLDAGYHVQFIDFAAEGYNKDRLHNLVRMQDIIGVSMLACDRQASLTIIDQIREVSPSIPIIVGGPDLSLEPRVPDKVDVAVVGEADHTIVQIVDAILNEGNLSDCPGVLFRDRKTGEIRKGKPEIVPTDLNSIKFPARHLVDRNRYSFLGKGQAGKIASIITSRGCPYRCKYCVVKSTEQYRYRDRSPENVLQEIEEIYKEGYKFLFIIDNNFFVNKKRVHVIMDGILARNIKLRIVVQGRVDLVDESLVRKMKEAGLRILSCGFESGCQDVLDFYRKGTTVEQNREVIRLADKLGIYTFGNFILGAPIETRDHLQRTIDFAMHNPLDATKFSILWYIFGSTLWEQAYRNGLIKSEDLCVLCTKESSLGNFMQKELEQLCFDVTRQFYTRPKFWIRQIGKLIRVSSYDPYFTSQLTMGFLDIFFQRMQARLLKKV